MTIRFLTLICILLSPFIVVAEIAYSEPLCKKGVCFDSQKKLGETTLSMRGRCLGKYFIFKVFDGAFYTEQDDTSPEKLDPKYSRYLELNYRREISKEDFVEGAYKSLKSNPTINIEALQERIDTIHDSYTGVVEGDRYALAYSASDTTTCLSKNGESVVCLEGADFMKAYFSVWLSDYSIDSTCTNDLLSIN